MLNISTRTDFT